MRLRNWLLTGTSLAVLALVPAAAQAQQAEYQALVDARASGDATAVEAAQKAFLEACIAAGYANARECTAAVRGGGEPPAAERPAPAEEAPPAEEQPAPAEEQPAPAPEEAAPPAEQAAPAEEPAPRKRRQRAPAEEQAPAAEQAPAEQPAAPAEEQAPAAEQPAAPAEEQAQPAEKPAEPSAEDQQAKFVADLQAALDQYQAALNQAAGGDSAGARRAAARAEARILELCTTNGYSDIKSCIGQDLPPLPEPKAEEPPAKRRAAPAEEAPPAEAPAAPEQPGEQPPAEQPQAQQPAEAAPAEQPAAPAEQPAPAAEQPPAPAEQPAAPAAEQPAEAGPADTPPEAPANDPQAQAQDDLNTAVELYNVGIGQLQGGDASGKSTIDAANQRFAQICERLGQNDVNACLAQYGIQLAAVPELAQPAEPAAPPIAELPGADKEVTPDAVEVLPEAVAPEAAAPILDSAKDRRTRRARGETPAAEAPAQPEEPAAPPPSDDKAAQAELAPVEVKSLKSVEGEALAADALPQLEVPQNVTVINNITNVTNVNNINNTTITNNNGGGANDGRGGNGGRGGNDGRRPGGGGGGGAGGGGGGGNGPNYTNSGFIFNLGVNLVISNPAQDFDRIRDSDRDEVDYQRLPGGRIKETITRPNGVQIVTIRDRFGQVLRRSRVTPDGREYILAYYDQDEDQNDDTFTNWRDPGDELPPLRLTIPIRDYILDADEADEDEVESFFREPPVERVRQIYTIEDVKRSARIRDSVRRVEVGGLTFDSGAATISRSQVGALSKVANAMLKLLDDNPAETFLIEGHTDAVGSDQANLILSDQRAATVARILTDFYDVPPENLVTQGYGERFLKVNTDGPEALNRRVDVKRITPLITVANN